MTAQLLRARYIESWHGDEALGAWHRSAHLAPHRLLVTIDTLALTGLRSPHLASTTLGLLPAFGQ